MWLPGWDLQNIYSFKAFHIFCFSIIYIFKNLSTSDVDTDSFKFIVVRRTLIFTFHNRLMIFFNVKLMRYQFWCTRCAFRLIKSRHWYSGRTCWNPKKCKNCKRAEKPNAVHEIEPNPSKDRVMLEGDNPSFWDEFIKFTFFLTELFIFVF
jgi:hypothetical protein